MLLPGLPLLMGADAPAANSGGVAVDVLASGRVTRRSRNLYATKFIFRESDFTR